MEAQVNGSGCHRQISCEAGNSTIHCLEARLWTFVKWKALQNYVLDQKLWVTKSATAPAVQEAVSIVAQPMASSSTTTGASPSSATMTVAKIGDLPRYQDIILGAIRALSLIHI